MIEIDCGNIEHGASLTIPKRDQQPLPRPNNLVPTYPVSATQVSNRNPILFSYTIEAVANTDLMVKSVSLVIGLLLYSPSNC